MKDNLSIVIVMLVFVVLMVIFPLYNYFERQDDMSYNLVLKSTTNFVDEIINCGYIDQEMYDDFIQEIAVTGNLYDIQLEAHKKTYTKDPYNLASDTYVEQYNIDYNADIFDENTGATKDSNVRIDDKVLKDGVYQLNVGDQIYVKLKNSSTTMAGAIFNVIVPTSSTERIAVNYGGIIKNNAWEKQNISNLFKKDIYIQMVPDIDTTPGISMQVNGRPTYALDAFTKVSFTVKIANYAETIVSDIAGLLKNNLRLTGFENNNFLRPVSVTKIDNANEWRVDFDLEEIENISSFFGSDYYKSCTVKLDEKIIQGNFFKNEATESDMITVKIIADDNYIPKITGPYLSGNSYTSYSIDLTKTIVYYVDYYNAILNVDADGLKDYIDVNNFTYDNMTVENQVNNKRFKITFTNVRGTPEDKIKININANWCKYIDLDTLQRLNVHALTSSQATLKFYSRYYRTPGIYEFVVPASGTYFLRVRGASGGGNTSSGGSRGGNGGGVVGDIYLTKDTVLYIVVGGKGKIGTQSNSGGYNGGGDGVGTGYGGGGATDIRLSSTKITSPDQGLDTRIIVAGGGGGADNADSGALGAIDDGSGGRGGSYDGGRWINSSYFYYGENGYTDGVLSSTVKGGTHNSGYKLGIGAKSTLTDDHGGGGGGYYGGMASNHYNGGGAGGSSYTGPSFTSYGYLKSGNVGDGWAQIGYGTWN